MNRYAFILLVAVVLLISACEGIVRGNAKLYEIDIQKIPVFNTKQAIHLVNAFATPRIVNMSEGSNTPSRGDLKQLTDTCIELLSTALEKRDIALIPQGKPVTMVVHHIQSHAGYWVRQTSLQLDAKLESGKVITITVDYRSPGDSFRAINASLRKAVVNLLNHEDFIRYVSTGKSG